MSAAAQWSTKKYSLLLSLACASGCSSSSNGAAPDGGTADSAVADSGASTDAAAPTDAQAPTACRQVQTDRGPVLGADSTGACTYLGIPYAAPPKDALRWKAPQPAAAWTTPRPSMAGSGCPQTASAFGDASTDEDCLYVNVWIPAAASGGPSPTPRPVMVFVHGGGFVGGSGNQALFDGTRLANSTGAVVVTLNYRLGPFGFLSSPALRTEDPAHPSAGNYGIEDQIAAFQWVKGNAAAFGGDPSNVTIFGESAGGTSMLAHLASTKSKGLFEHVIVESAWLLPGATAFTETIADQGGALLAKMLQCTSEASLLSCMRGKSVADVLAAAPNSGGLFGNPINWGPVIDGYILADDPVKVFAQGTFDKVPTVIGNNKNEGTLFFFMGAGLTVMPPTDPASYEALEEGLSPGNGAVIVAEYPISAFQGSYAGAASEALGDGAFVCGARRVARALAAAGVPTFRYDFTHTLAGLPSELGAFHASELPFVFGNPLSPQLPLSADELPLSQKFMGYWGSMATQGDPNGAGQFAWPRYDMTTEAQIALDLTLSTESAFKKAACDFWDGLH